MNYLRGAFSAASSYYNGLPPINASTLTGAIDVIVIERLDENGNVELACTPFHVRFGKWQVLRPGEKQVTVLVNGSPIPYSMKIGDAGEAFFVFETEEDVPRELMTSPILGPTEIGGNKDAREQHAKAGRFGAERDIDDEDTEDDAQHSLPEGVMQRSTLKDNGSEPSFFDLSGKAAASTSSLPSASSTPPLSPSSPPTSISTFDSSKQEEPSNSNFTVTSGSILGRTASFTKQVSQTVLSVAPGVANLAKSAVLSGPDMATDSAHHLTDKIKAISGPRRLGSLSPQKGDEALPEIDGNTGNPPEVLYTEDAVLDMAGYHGDGQISPLDQGSAASSPGLDDVPNNVGGALRSISDDVLHQTTRDDDRTPRPSISFETYEPVSSVELSRSISSPGPSREHQRFETTPRLPSQLSTELQAHMHHSPPSASLRIPHSRSASAGFRGSSAPLELNMPSTSHLSTSPEYSWEWGAFPTRSPARPAFPLSDDEREARGPSHLRNHSVKSDGDFEHVFDEGGKLTADSEDKNIIWVTLGSGKFAFQLSLCGGEFVKNYQMEDSNVFDKQIIDFDKLLEDPAIVRNVDLVMKWEDRYLTRGDSSTLMRALSIWREATIKSGYPSRPTSPVSDDEASRLPASMTAPSNKRTSGSTWTRWWSRSRVDLTVTQTSSQTSIKSAPPNIALTKPAEPIKKEMPSPSASVRTVSSPLPHQKHYAKTLRLTSDQLKALNLKKGANTITFSLSTTGAVACTARIFVWHYTDHIVVSDIDGTITKSDALGHIYTMIGRDWTHIGVAKLYTDIARNGYKMMYLTSRAIGQADSTRDYLKSIKQNNYQLPEGPVIMSPDRLMASLHREVIMKKPEVFKMACLRDIQRLFGPNSKEPFYAGFGNRITDALSYRSVNIPSARIFTIDSSGEVKMELLELAGYKSSYIHMSDLVDQMFPPINRKWAQEFTDFNFWRDPVPECDLPDLPPLSPALSAVSDASGGSRLSRLRTFSLARQPVKPNMAEVAVQAEIAAHVDGRAHRARSTSPLSHESVTEDQDSISDPEEEDGGYHARARRRLSFDSMPGSLPEDDQYSDREDRAEGESEEGEEEYDEYEGEEEEPIFDESLLDGQMLARVPF